MKIKTLGAGHWTLGLGSWVLGLGFGTMPCILFLRSAPWV